MREPEPVILDGGFTVLDSLQQFEAFLSTLDGVYSADALFYRAEELGISQLAAKGIIDSLINRGDLFNIPAVVKRDDCGCYAELDGFKLYTHEAELDQAISTELLAGINYEEEELRWCAANIQPGDVVIDVGANIGWHTVHFSRFTGSSGLVIAFEPEPGNFQLLKRNLCSNSCQNAIAFKVALMHEAGIVRLYTNPRNQGDHRIWSCSTSSSIEVSAVTLDLMKINVEIGFLKIDVQGAELLVLYGAQELINRQRSLAMLIEFWPLGLSVLGGGVAQFMNALAYFGFRVYMISAGRLVEVESAPLPEFSDKFVNLLCIK